MRVQWQRFLVVRANGREVRIPTHNCQWCTDEAICSSCAAKADATRAASRPPPNPTPTIERQEP